MSVSGLSTASDPALPLASHPRRGAITGLGGVALDAVTLSLFTAAIFTGASLMFVIQPMVGKILLPMLGGAPAVWNTCMVFFQATLLIGYLSAHLLTKHFYLRGQIVIFVAVLLLAMQTIPIQVGPAWIERLLGGASPNGWLLSVLLFQVAPAFWVLSVTSPLMQKWFARSGHPQAADPYFLYAAGNIGSILALMAYPLWIEAQWGVMSQTHGWAFGFGGFTILAALCGVASLHGHLRQRSESHRESTAIQGHLSASVLSSPPALNWTRRGGWVMLAFVPSSLMLGVTTYISTDVSSIPLIWVVPLAMYLLTFVFAFAQRQFFSHYWLQRVAALSILAITVTMVAGANDPPALIVPLHLLMFFAVAMLCHGRLAADRPAEQHLTDFYLWLSVGGVLGGLFNAVIAPALFLTIVEYPLVMIAATLLVDTGNPDGDRTGRNKYARPALFGAMIFTLTIGLDWATTGLVPASWFASMNSLMPFSATIPFSATQIQMLFAFGIPAALVLHKLDSGRYFTVGLAAIFLVSIWHDYTDSTMLRRDRNFYGTIGTASKQLSGGTVVQMFHGNTVHGWQWADPDRRGIPLTYYGSNSGVGRLIQAMQQRSDRLRVGGIGLGAGTLAATMRPHDSIVFYEINPLVIDHAERYFTFLEDARRRGADVQLRLGDARLVLDEELRQGKSAADQKYDILVIDAFSSDSIPVHLITDESLQIYMRHIRPDGVVAVHITNRYLQLDSVLGDLAAHQGLVSFSYRYNDANRQHAIDEQTGETSSTWILIARSDAHLGTLQDNPRLKPLPTHRGRRIWTDDFTNVMSVLQTSH